MFLLTAGLLLSGQLVFASSHEENKSVKFEDMLRDVKVEILETANKKTPSIVLINKCGDIVAELYGDKNELNEKFQSTIKKGVLVTSSHSLEVYLIN